MIIFQARIPPVLMPPAALNINKESLEEILRTVNETPSFICQTEAKAAVVVATSPTVNEILSGKIMKQLALSKIE